MLLLALAACGGESEATSAVALASSVSTCAAIGTGDRGLWVWQTSAVTDPGEADAVIAFATSHRVRRLYAHAQHVVDGPPEARERLAAFVRAAHAACLEVDLLFGATEWTSPGPGGQDEAVGLVLATAAFGDAHPDARPDGAHFDVEPYTTDAWNADREGTENAFLDLLERLHAAASAHDLPLTLDVAFWYVGETVTRDGATRSFGELVIDRVDRIVIMAYRDFAGVDHDNGIVDVASEELAYASRVGRDAYVGIETDPNAPDAQSFADEGADATTRELEASRVYFTTHPGFERYRGSAIHDYRWARVLR